ncbi:MAG TPA: glycosyltransferase [Chitinispirillaceae bacterium]|nr:glycosyltransferase [Chitinispirillaceae bacterium]
MNQISMVIPTYNERENIPLLMDDVFKSIIGCKDINLEVIVVDDNSPDGTGEIVDELSKIYPIKAIHRKRKMGLGSAVMEGFRLSEREYLVFKRLIGFE